MAAPGGGCSLLCAVNNIAVSGEACLYSILGFNF